MNTGIDSPKIDQLADSIFDIIRGKGVMVIKISDIKKAILDTLESPAERIARKLIDECAKYGGLSWFKLTTDSHQVYIKLVQEELDVLLQQRNESNETGT